MDKSGWVKKILISKVVSVFEICFEIFGISGHFVGSQVQSRMIFFSEIALSYSLQKRGSYEADFYSLRPLKLVHSGSMSPW